MDTVLMAAARTAHDDATAAAAAAAAAALLAEQGEAQTAIEAVIAPQTFASAGLLWHATSPMVAGDGSLFLAFHQGVVSIVELVDDQWTFRSGVAELADIGLWLHHQGL